MRPRAGWLLLLFCFTVIRGNAQVRRFSEVIQPSLPRFEFLVHESSSVEANEARRITSIEILSAGKHLQSFQFPDDDDAPIDFAPGAPVTFEDVNCDGYKDLLVRQLVGIHGDAWYSLYLFDQVKHRFVVYPPFRQLPYVSTDCRTGHIKTYLNSGAAGCVYEAGWYRWAGRELVPSRTESQDGGDNGSFIRTIEVWRNGKESIVLETQVPIDDCHISNGALRASQK
jgi:hypothetical protein